LEAESPEAFVDRRYFKGEEVPACEEAGISVTLPKPQTSDAKSEGRFGKQDFRYVAAEDIYICPADPNAMRTRRETVEHPGPVHRVIEVGQIILGPGPAGIEGAVLAQKSPQG
jgi:hypothetical protein